MSENGSDSDQNSSGRKSKNGDEQIQTMSVGEIDPAILFVRERAKIRYTKEDLLEIAKNPASRSKPDFLDPNEVCVSVLDPEKWNLERKKSDTPENGPKNGDNGDLRRRAGDPRERIRKENDGIVLSPQRRSFNSGCFVPANKDLLGTKNDAPAPIMVGREMPSSTRRIGSGRIIRDTWDSEKDSGDPEFGFGRGLQTRNNERDDKYGSDKYGLNREENKFGERRSFGREIEKEKDTARGRNMRFGDNRRRYSDNKEDEPEWFSSGPISQNDTIELRGFDDDKNKKKKPGTARAKRTKEWQKKKDVIVEDKETDEETGKKEKTYPDNQNQKEEPNEEDSASGNQAMKKANDQKKTPHEHLFDFDEFLKGESISGLLSNQAEEEATKLTSRFSRWFRKDSPSKDASSGSSSIHEDNHVIKDLMKDINESSSIPVNIRPPIDSNTHFAPISPADNNHGGLENLMGDKARPIMGQTVNIMDILSRGKQQPDGWKGQAPPGTQIVGGKILSLDELEAEIRQHNGEFGNIQKGLASKPDEEMTAAFKKLLLQAGETSLTQNGPMNKPNSAMSLLEMLKHSQQQDEARFAAAQAAASQQQQHQLLNAMHAQHHQPNPTHNELGMKLQHKQQFDMIGKLMAAGAQMRASPLSDLGMQQSRELLSRPEAQAILQGLKRGEITIQHLYQQLANPALQPRHREMLVTILKLHSVNSHNASYGPSPRVLSPVPIPTPHHLYPPQQQSNQMQQQLRVSPLPPTAMHQRIPSPRELQVHTQNILQRALIKKKLEEQTENFRKKQEMHRAVSPNQTAGSSVQQGTQSGTKGLSSPTPLAFTPTSVLRKMTADKDEGKENKLIVDSGMKPQGRPLTGMRQQPQVTVNNQQWNQSYPMKQAGRPIVKANNYQSQTPDQFFAQLAAQQQSMPQQRGYQPVPSIQHRKPIASQQYPPPVSQYTAQSAYASNPIPQNFALQPTPQQLRAQHQHRSSNNAQPPTTNNNQPPVGAQPASHMQNNQQQKMGYSNPQPGSMNWQQFLNSAAQQGSRSGMTSNRPPLNSDGLSPSTTDQLTRWFSPDLLERARVGDLPSTANLARLEEIERQAAAPVHN